MTPHLVPLTLVAYLGACRTPHSIEAPPTELRPARRPSKAPSPFNRCWFASCRSACPAARSRTGTCSHWSNVTMVDDGYIAPAICRAEACSASQIETCGRICGAPRAYVHECTARGGGPAPRYCASVTGTIELLTVLAACVQRTISLPSPGGSWISSVSVASLTLHASWALWWLKPYCFYYYYYHLVSRYCACLSIGNDDDDHHWIQFFFSFFECFWNRGGTIDLDLMPDWPVFVSPCASNGPAGGALSRTWNLRYGAQYKFAWFQGAALRARCAHTWVSTAKGTCHRSRHSLFGPYGRISFTLWCNGNRTFTTRNTQVCNVDYYHGNALANRSTMCNCFLRQSGGCKSAMLE